MIPTIKRSDLGPIGSYNNEPDSFRLALSRGEPSKAALI